MSDTPTPTPPTPSATPSEPPDLLCRVYDELRTLAERKLAAEPPGQTLQATALVHEAWLKIAAEPGRVWNDSRHFYAAAARAMRQILVDKARRKHTLRHGGGWLRIDDPDFETLATAETSPDGAVDALCEALDQLAVTHPEHAELVQLRFFAGLTLERVAAVLGMSEPTAKRRWAFARAWLFRRIQEIRDPRSP